MTFEREHDPRQPSRAEAERENLPGDFQLPPSDEDLAAIKRAIAAAHPLPPGFRDEAF